FMLIYALQGPGPEAMLEKAQRNVDKFTQALKAPNPDYYGVFQLFDQASNELNTIVSRYLDTPQASQARETLLYLQAGNHFRMGMEALDNNAEKNWQQAL